MTFETTAFLFLKTLHSPIRPEYKQKWSHPDSNWGPKNQNLICCPYTMEPFTLEYNLVYLCTLMTFPFQKTKGTIGIEPMTTGTAVLCSTAELCALSAIHFILTFHSRCPDADKNAPRGARTHDLTVKSRTLYRLS